MAAASSPNSLLQNPTFNPNLLFSKTPTPILNFCSKPVDVSKFRIIYAGAQKNVGPSGVTIVIIKKDLIGRAQAITPVMLDYKIQAKNKSLYNTPPCFAIYMCGLVFEHLLEQGGLEEIEKKNMKKARILYDAIDGSGGFYRCSVEKSMRSLMNVPFTLERSNLEAELIKEAVKEGIGYKPTTDLQTGLKKFVKWYMPYYGYHQHGKRV